MPDTAVPDEAWSPDASGPRPTRSSYVELDGYTDFTPVATGGDSTVYRAVQVGLGRPVAVKILAVDPDGGDDRAARFQRELEITVRLGRAHPHIVSVLDTRVLPDGRPCIVMEYFDDGSLHDRLRARGPLPASEVIAIGVVIADALAFAHGQGVLHRDVKPQNILVLPTSFVLADFGLARGADAGHTSSLERFSYRHAAPQALDGELPDAADDVYSLGSTLFTLLDGRPPFAADDPAADTPHAYIRRVRTASPREISIKGVPAGLATIIMRCLAKRREDRFPDAASLRDALSAVAAEERAWAPDGTPSGSPTLGALRTPPPTGPVVVPAAIPTIASPGPAAVPATPPPTAAPAGPPMDERRAESLSEPVASPPAGQGRAVPPAAVPPSEPSEATMPVESLGRSMWPIESSPDLSWADRSSNAVLGGMRPDAPPDAPPEPRRGSSLPRLVVLIGIALLLGVFLTVAIAWVRGLGTVPVAGEAGSPSPSVARETPRPPNTATPSPAPTAAERVDDPAIAPRITKINDRRTSLEVTWEDRSGGKAVFVVVEVGGGGGVPLAQTGAGKTSVVVDGVDPARPYCLAVIAVTESAQGISQLQCTGVRHTRSPR